jgi:hypothetical protein
MFKHNVTQVNFFSSFLGSTNTSKHSQKSRQTSTAASIHMGCTSDAFSTSCNGKLCSIWTVMESQYVCMPVLQWSVTSLPWRIWWINSQFTSPYEGNTLYSSWCCSLSQALAFSTTALHTFLSDAFCFEIITLKYSSWSSSHFSFYSLICLHSSGLLWLFFSMCHISYPNISSHPTTFNNIDNTYDQIWSTDYFLAHISNKNMTIVRILCWLDQSAFILCVRWHKAISMYFGWNV